MTLIRYFDRHIKEVNHHCTAINFLRHFIIREIFLQTEEEIVAVLTGMKLKAGRDRYWKTISGCWRQSSILLSGVMRKKRLAQAGLLPLCGSCTQPLRARLRSSGAQREWNSGLIAVITLQLTTWPRYNFSEQSHPCRTASPLLIFSIQLKSLTTDNSVTESQLLGRVKTVVLVGHFGTITPAERPT